MRRTSFTRRAARLGLNKPRPQLPGPRVVYFVDVYANYYDQELAESVVAVLRHAEVNVFVPSRQRSSGMAALIVGDVDHAREPALANLRVLANAVRDGYTVVCSEPTAALMLRQEYVKLTEDLDAELVAANTMDVGQYLLGLEARGQLPQAARAAACPRRLSSAVPSRERSTSARRASSCCATFSRSTSSSSTAAARAWEALTGWRAIASGPRSAPAAG